MAYTWAYIVYTVLSIYTMIGVLFAVVFVIAGVNRIDEAAKGASVWYRLIIIPGTIALWPVLLIKWFKSPHP